MTTDYTWIYPHRTAEATIRKIREIAPTSEFIYYLYVVDKDDKLLGALSLRTLLLADPAESIDTIMETDLVDDPSRHVVARTSRRRSRATICSPCRSSTTRGKMLGIVTVDDAIDAIMPEDMARKLPQFTARRHSHRGAQRRRLATRRARSAPTALAVALAAAARGRARPGLRHGVGRQRRRRHRDLLGRRRAVRLQHSLGADSARRRADRRARDVDAHGLRHRQGPRGALPRELRRSRSRSSRWSCSSSSTR